MKRTSMPRSTPSVVVSLVALGALAVSHSAAAQGRGRGGGRHGDRPGGPPDGATVVAFVDPSTLVRDMARQQVAVGGRSEQRIVAPARHCAGLAPGASKSVSLPDVRWGLRTTTPVAARRTKGTLSWPGQPRKEEVLPDGMPGSSERAFTFPRPGPRSIRVTLLAVAGSGAQFELGDGSVRTIGNTVQPAPTRGTGVDDGTSNTAIVGETSRPGPTTGGRDGTSNTVIVGETSRPGQTVCVSDVFVQDPPIEIRVDVAGPQGQSPAERRSAF